MNIWFYAKCFLIGVSASSAVGPIFILTFNRGALHGFWKGFATAFGSALADALFFTLGLFAILERIEHSRNVLLFLDSIGGLFLIGLGIHTLKSQKKDLNNTLPPDLNVILTMAKSFILTMVNPFVLFFFMFISVQILPEGVSRLSLNKILSGSLMVMAGSLTVLGMVALTASYVGSTISKRKLNMISYVTGLIFIGAGIYFLGDFLFKLLH